MGSVLERHLDTLAAALPGFREQADQLRQWSEVLAGTLAAGGRLLAAGNGGSAEQAQHLTAELVGKLRMDRPAFSAIALGAEPAGLTAISNDYGYEEAFARQVRAHGRPGDVLVTLSTSGRSPNLLAAAAAATAAGLHCWAMTGPVPNPLSAGSGESLAVPSDEPQVVQELHLVAIHVLCEHLDARLTAERWEALSR